MIKKSPYFSIAMKLNAILNDKDWGNTKFMSNCSNTRTKSSYDFQLFKKQSWELLGSMFAAQIWGFLEKSAQFWIRMGQRMRTDDEFCVGVAETENKSKITCRLALITLFTFIYSGFIFVLCDLISLGIDK